jgi:hypothetical protein
MDRFSEFTFDEVTRLLLSLPAFYGDSTNPLYLELHRELDKRNEEHDMLLEKEKRENSIICECCDQITGPKPENPLADSSV